MKRKYISVTPFLFLRCAEMNASLAVFYDKKDFSEVIPDGQLYYTMHRAR